MADSGDQGQSFDLSSFQASRATLGLTLESGDITQGRGIRIEHGEGGFTISVRASQGGLTTAPRPLTPEEDGELLSALQDELGAPPSGVDVAALQAAVCLLSERPGYPSGSP